MAALKDYPAMHTGKGSQQTDIPVVQLDWGNAQVLSLGSGSASSTIYGPGDTIFEMCSSVAAWYNVSNTSAAVGVSGNHLLPANTVRYVYVMDELFISAIGVTSGSMSIVPALLIG